ncbi:MAG: MerR family transcriptional regulator [Pseudomonadales bacterium]|nr:MerR family transcriptional regulator [Pseudomonadales bacterium]
MKIGELAERTGLATSKIRFYESIGLLKMVKRKQNGYRTYPPEAITVLTLITKAQKAGFSLDELRTLLPEDFDKWDHGSLMKALEQKVHDIEEIQKKLAESKELLLEVQAQIQARPVDMDCSDNAKRVLDHFGVGENLQREVAQSKRNNSI